MRWQGDLPFVQGTRFISDPRQGHFFLDLLNAEEKMELDPKPDENLIANILTPRPLFPLGRHNMLFSRILYYVWREPLFFFSPWWTSFCRSWLCGLFSWWHFIQRALSHVVPAGCWQDGMGVCQREAQHIPVLWEGERPCWGAGGIHTPKGKEVSEYVFNFHGFFKKSLLKPGLNSAWSEGN